MPSDDQAGTFVLEPTTYTLESATRPFLQSPDSPVRERRSRPSPEDDEKPGATVPDVSTEPPAQAVPPLHEDVVVVSRDTAGAQSGSYAPGLIVPLFVIAFVAVGTLAFFAMRLWRGKL